MKQKRKGIFLAIVLIITSTIAFSLGFNPRFYEIQSFHPGHSHDSDETIGAPGHSGRTDKFGCHNKSVPYHCHQMNTKQGLARIAFLIKWIGYFLSGLIFIVFAFYVKASEIFVFLLLSLIPAVIGYAISWVIEGFLEK